MSKTLVFASALFLGVAAFGFSGETALAASAKKADTAKRAECERKATLYHYMGEQRSKWIRQCLAGSGRSPGKPMARQPIVLPSDSTEVPTVMPLRSGSPPSTSMGGTVPSNAPVVRSAPVGGSSGTSISGSSATSITGSSNNSIGRSGR